jgi:hypothetical protein
METYKIVCERKNGWFNTWDSWEINATSEEEVNKYLERIASPGCTYEVSKIIVQPVKTVSYNEILEKFRLKEKEEARLKRKKLYESLKKEFDDDKESVASVSP